MTVFLSRLHAFTAIMPQNPGQIARSLVSRAALGLSLLLAGLGSGLAQAQEQADAVALSDAAQETTTMGGGRYVGLDAAAAGQPAPL